MTFHGTNISDTELSPLVFSWTSFRHLSLSSLGDWAVLWVFLKLLEFFSKVCGSFIFGVLGSLENISGGLLDWVRTYSVDLLFCCIFIMCPEPCGFLSLVVCLMWVYGRPSVELAQELHAWTGKWAAGWELDLLVWRCCGGWWGQGTWKALPCTAHPDAACKCGDSAGMAWGQQPSRQRQFASCVSHS